MGKTIGLLSQIKTVAPNCASGPCMYCHTHLHFKKNFLFSLKNVLDEAVKIIFVLHPNS